MEEMTKKGPNLTLRLPVLSTVEPPTATGRLYATITAFPRERWWRSWKVTNREKERELERNAGDKRKKVRVRNKTSLGVLKE